jgi:hypothetical protein
MLSPAFIHDQCSVGALLLPEQFEPSVWQEMTIKGAPVTLASGVLAER